MRRWIPALAAACLCSFALPVCGQFVEQVLEQSAISRAEAVKRMVETKPEAAAQAEAFRSHMPLLPLGWDLDQRAWYAPYYEVAFHQGILEPLPDRSLRTSDPLTVHDALIMRARSLGLIPSAQSAEVPLVPAMPQLEELLTSKGVTLPQDRGSGALISRDDFLRLLQTAAAEPSVADQQPQQQSSSSSAASIPSAVAAPGTADPFPMQAGNRKPLTAEERAALQYASVKPFAITMPTLGISDLTVTHPDDPSTSEGILAPLDRGVGHLFSFPGNGSTVMIYGHSSGYPWDVSQFTQIFRQINRLNVGDPIYVTYAGTLYVYVVSGKETVAASNTDALQNSGDGEQLLLYTCWPPDDISQRYLVRAAPVDVIPIY